MNDIADQIHARKETLKKRIPIVVLALEKAIAPQKRELINEITRINQQNSSRRSKFIALQKVESKTRDLAQEHFACKKGCSWCCYMPTELSQTEADAIGFAIGKKATQLKQTGRAHENRNSHTGSPCVFLKDDCCSIYENRPYVCRQYVNVDVDNLLCGPDNLMLAELKDPRATGIPTLADPLIGAFHQLNGEDVIADIRDFFPDGLTSK
jgi:hypothetical protein